MFHRFFKKAKKNRKGAMTIEIIIGMMLFLLGFSFIVDLIILGGKYQVVSQTTTSIARAAGTQGGILTAAPEGYPGGSSSYITRQEVDNRINQIMNDNGIDTFNTTLPGRTDYGQYMDVGIEFEYEFALLSNFIPGNLTVTFNSERLAFSEFKYRYDDFDGS